MTPKSGLHWIAIFLLPCILFIVSLLTYAFHENYYFNHYTEREIYSKFSESPQIIDEYSNELIRYISTGKGDISWFSEREQLHLVDVMKLFTIAQGLIIILVVVFVGVCLYYRNHVSPIFYYGGIATFGVLLLFSLVFFNFNASFYLFHLMSFSNDLWLLSATDKLILLFPEEFFRAITLSIVYLTFSLGGISIILGKLMAVDIDAKNP